MTKELFISLVHGAQHDAGSLSNFTEKVERYEDDMVSSNQDPVAAFIAALLANTGGDVDDAVYDFNFFFAELERAKQRLQKLNLLA